MRETRTAFGLLLLTLLPVFGCTPRGGRESGLIERDIGEIVIPIGGMQIEETFQIENPNPNTSLSLQLKERSCTCLVSSPATQLTPGGTALISLSSALPCITQSLDWTAVYSTDSASLPEVKLRLRGRAYARLAVHPAVLPRMELRLGETRVVSFVVLCALEDHERDATPTVECHSPDISVSTVEREIVRGERVLVHRMNCEAIVRCSEVDFTRLGEHEAVHQIVIDCGDRTLLGPKLSWRPQRLIRATPTVMYFAANGDLHSRHLVLQGEHPFAVRSATDAAGVLSIWMDSSRVAQRHELGISLTADGNAAVASSLNLPVATLAGTLEITTDHPLQPVVRVPYHVIGNVISID